MEKLSFNEVRKVSSKTHATIHNCPQPLQKSLENAKISDAQSVQAKIDNERLGSR